MPDEYKTVETGFIKLGAPGHFVNGVLTGKEMKELKFGPVLSYEFTAIAGKGHNEDDKDYELTEGDTSSFLDHFSIHKEMKSIKLGQKFKVTRLDDKENAAKDGKYKDHKVEAGPMSEEYVALNQLENADEPSPNEPPFADVH